MQSGIRSVLFCFVFVLFSESTAESLAIVNEKP